MAPTDPTSPASTRRPSAPTLSPSGQTPRPTSVMTMPPSMSTMPPSMSTMPPSMGTMPPSDGDGDGEMDSTSPPSSQPSTSAPTSAPVAPQVSPSATRLAAAVVSSELQPLVGSTAGGRVVEGVSSVESSGGDVEVEVTLAGDASTFTAAAKQAALESFATRLSIPITRFGNVQVRVGSLILSFSILNPPVAPVVLPIPQSDGDDGSMPGWMIAVVVCAVVAAVVGLVLVGVFCCRKEDKAELGKTEETKVVPDIETVVKNQPYS